MFLRKKKIDEQKIQSKVLNNLLKVAVWLIIGFILFRGVVSIVRGDRSTALKSDFMDAKETQELKNHLKEIAVSFAEDFAEDYMTYYGNNEEYQKRLNEYTDLQFTRNQNKTMEVIYANSTKSKWVNKELILVDCRLKVTYNSEKKLLSDSTSKNNKEFSEFYEPDTKLINLRVPVKIINGKNIIESYPTFIGSRNKALTKKERSIPGNDIDNESIKSKIRDVINNFLDAYCDGNKTDMEYYMLNQKNLKGLNKKFEVEKLFDDNFIIKKYDDDYYAKVNFKLTDSDNEFMQSMEFVLVYKDNKYLIKQFDTTLNY